MIGSSLVATMSLAASIKYDHATRVDDSRQTILIYNGDASTYNHLECRNEMRYLNAREEDRPKIMAEIVTSLRGDAFNVREI